MGDRALLVVPDHQGLTKVPDLQNLHGHHFHALRAVAAAAREQAVAAAAVPKAVAPVAVIAAEAEDRVVVMTDEIEREAKDRHAAVLHRHRRKYVHNG